MSHKSRHSDKYSGCSSSSRRRDSPSRRSSPGPSHRSSRPKDDISLPESFGRIRAARSDDNENVFQRMKSFVNSPLQVLYKYLSTKEKVKVWTRNYKEVRGVMTGYIVAFDKHWNIIMSDVDEAFIKYKKSKTPFLRDLAPNENLPDFPVKTPKMKSEAKSETKSDKKKEEGSEKKRKRAKRSKATSERRHVGMMFVRGDNIVMICPAVEEDGEEEEEEAEGE